MIKKLFGTPLNRTLSVSALLLFLTIIYTFPLIQNFFTHIPGYGDDINQYFWCHWWFGEAIEKGTHPWNTDYQWFPNGTSLIFSTNRFVSAAIGWLFSPLLGLIGSYNLMNMLTFVISGLGVYLFARELTDNDYGAIAAAIIFAFNPLRLNKLMHHHFLLATYCFGFILWLLVRIIKGGKHKYRDGIIAGVLYAFTFYDSPFLFVFLVLASLIVVIWLSLSGFKDFWKAEVLKPLVLLFAVFLLIASPMLFLIWNDYPQYGSMPYAQGAETYSNDALHLISPSPLPYSPFGGKTMPLFSKRNFTYNTHEENFAPIGWVVLPLSILGWTVTRKKSAYANLFLFAACVFAILSLGPFLHILGNSQFQLPRDTSPTKIPLLYKHLDFLPLISLIRAPNRLMLMAFLFLGLLTAFAFPYIQRKFKDKATAISLILLGLIVIDYFPHGIDIQEQFEVDESIKAIGKEKGDFGVLPIGLMYGENLRNGPVYNKPQTAGYTSRTTLFSRPIQDFSVIMLDRTLTSPRETRILKKLPGYKDNIENMLKAWGIGAIITKGNPERAIAIKNHLSVKTLAKNDQYASFRLLNLDEKLDNGIVFNTDSFAKMPEAGLNSSSHSSLFWTDKHGFVICVPDSLMQEGNISIECASVLRSLPDQPVRVWFYCNRELVGSWILKNKMQRFSFKLKPDHKRLPVNIIAFRTELLGKTAQDSAIPFSLSVTSGNLYAGNTSSISFNNTDLLIQKHRSSTIQVAFLPPVPNKSPLLKSYSPVKAESLNSMMDDFKRNRQFSWVLISTTGNIPNTAAEILVDLLGKNGISLTKNKIRGKSFISLFNREDKNGFYYSRPKANINLCINKDPEKDDPLVDIRGVYFR